MKSIIDIMKDITDINIVNDYLHYPGISSCIMQSVSSSLLPADINMILLSINDVGSFRVL
jgi:hypothetical protein